MTTISKIKQELLVWSVIVGVFAVLTLVAINLDSIRKVRLFNKEAAESSPSQVNSSALHQPGNSVVLAQ